MKEYLFEYDHAGATWGLTIKADSMADAQARMSRMSLARYVGEGVARIPVAPNWFARLFGKQATGED